MGREDWIHPEDFRLLVKNVRLARRWSQRELAAAAGLSANSIYDYEKGIVPPRKTAERLVEASGCSLRDLEIGLVPGLILLRLPGEPLEGGPESPNAGFLPAMAGVLRAAQASLAAARRSERRQARATAPPPAASLREAAGPCCQTLAQATPFERQVLLARVPAYRGWAIVERLCLDSEKAAAAGADRALELADLALQAVATVDEEPAQARAAGFAWAYVGHARRMRNDLDEARAAFARSARLWQEGAAADSLPLEGWRLQDLEAR